MITTGIIGLLLLAAIVIFLFGVKITESFDYDRNKTVSHRQSIRLWGFAPLVVALIFAGFSMVHIVQARTQGVKVTFGATSENTLSPGLNLTWPWQDVKTVDTTRQVANYNGGDGEDDHGRISVLLGNGNTSLAYGSVTWQINPDKANLAYSDFRGDQDTVEMVYSRLVRPQFKAAMNDVWGTYNPTSQIAALLGKDQAISAADIDFSPDFEAITTAVKANFEKRMAQDDIVQVIDVTVSFVDFDDKTKSQISNYQAEVQKTITAQQAVQTATAQAEANRLLAESISKDPNVLASRCFDLIASGDFTPPIGFSCYPGNSNTTGVIVSPPAK